MIYAINAQSEWVPKCPHGQRAEWGYWGNYKSLHMMTQSQTNPKASTWLAKPQCCLESPDRQRSRCTYVPAEM